MVNLVLSKVDKTVLQSVDSLFSNTNDPYYKGHKVDTREYNYLHKYLDIYGAILDSNIHIMVIDAVPCQYIHKTIWVMSILHQFTILMFVRVNLIYIFFVHS